MSEKQLPKVSAIIANYNFGQWVNDAIKSVALQDYPNKRAVVIDDCSTDNSIEQINNLVKMDKVGENHIGAVSRGFLGSTEVLLFVLKKNGKQARARNEGIKLVWEDTHIFSILDADDVWKQGRLSKGVAKIIEKPEIIGAVYTDYDVLHVNNGNLLIREFKEPYSRKRLFQECIVHSGCTISKLALSKCGLYDEECPPCEDYELWTRISDQFLFYHIPESLCIVRITGKNDSVALPPEIWQKQVQLVWKKYQERHARPS